MTIDFRVAFQGGGANFITLLAASKAIYDFHQDSQSPFRVEKISGTSAGSIVAGLLSLDIDPELIRQHLIKHGEAAYDKIVQIPQKGFMGFGWGKKAASLAAGYPFFQYSALEEFVSELLSIDAVRNDPKLSNVNIPVVFTTSDLTRSEPKYWDSSVESQRDESLKAVISDSCAIPFVFKSLVGSSRAHIVDGGIVENFPLEKLTQDKEPSRVIGFSFDSEENRATDSVFSYLNSILSTAINSNVKTSARHIPQDNVISLPYEFGVLEFKRAMEVGLDHLFDKTVGEVSARLEKIIAREQEYEFRQNNASKFSRNFDPVGSATKLFDRYATENVKIRRLEVEWLVDSLRSASDPSKTATDTIKTTYDIVKPEDKETLAFKIHISTLSNRIDLTLSEVSVSDGHGNSIEFVPLIGKVKKFAASYNIPVYLFVDLDGLSESQDIIRIQHIDQVPSIFPKFMDPTSEEEKDSEDVASVCSYPHYDEIVWIVHLPQDIHDLCDFEPIDGVDEKVEVKGFVEGTIVKNFVGDTRTPMNFSSTRWVSSGTVTEGQVAGFKIVQKKSMN